MKVLILSPDMAHHNYFKKQNSLLLFSPQDFNQFSKNIIDDYNQLVDNLNEKNQSEWSWWGLSTSSRNIFFGQLYLDYSYYRYAQKIIEQENPDLVVCYKKSIQQALFIQNKHCKFRLCSEFIEPSLTSVIKNIFFLKICWAVFNYFHQIIINKFYALLSKVNENGIDKNQSYILIDSFIHDDSFINQQFQDTYFGDLLKYLPQEKALILPYYAFYKNKQTTFINMRKQSPSFLIPEDYLSFFDYLSAPIQFLIILYKNLLNKKLDATDHLIQSDLKTSFSSNNIQFILRHHLIKRINQKGIKIHSMLDWFEGQPLDKIQFLSMNTFFPMAKVHSYVGAFFSFAQGISFAVTKQEIKNHAAPGTLYFQGQGIAENQNKLCNSELKGEFAPAFRISSVSAKQNQNGEGPLIILPNMINVAVDLLQFVIEASLQYKKIHISIHPRMNKSILAPYLNQLLLQGKDVVIVKNIAEGILKSDVVLSTGTSAFIEAFKQGIPCVVIGSRTQLTLNFIPEQFENKMFCLCWSPELLQTTIVNIITTQDKSSYSLMLEQYITSPTHKNINDWLKNHFI